MIDSKTHQHMRVPLASLIAQEKDQVDVNFLDRNNLNNNAYRNNFGSNNYKPYPPNNGTFNKIVI